MYGFSVVAFFEFVVEYICVLFRYSNNNVGMKTCGYTASDYEYLEYGEAYAIVCGFECDVF